MDNKIQIVNASPQVICFGEAILDRLGPPGGDPEVDQAVDDYFGGAPANVACALAKLGTSTAFVGCLGSDEIGSRFADLMQSRGVNILGLEMTKTYPTRIVLVQRDHEGDRSFKGFVGAKDSFFADQFIDQEVLKNSWNVLSSNAKWLSLGTIPLANKVSRKSLLWSIEKAVSQGIKIAIDINWRPTFWDENNSPDSGPNDEVIIQIKSILSKASLLKLAKEEAIWFFGSIEPDVISHSLPNHPNVVVTDGSNPIKWFLAGFNGKTPAIKIPEVIDSTGAGDAFTAGLIHQLLINPVLPKSIEKINKLILFASACGAIVCLKPGAIKSQPTKEEVLSLYNSI